MMIIIVNVQALPGIYFNRKNVALSRSAHYINDKQSFSTANFNGWGLLEHIFISITEKSPAMQGSFNVRFVFYTVVNASIIWLNTFPIRGPKRIRTAITIIATNTKINAYSTKP
jgi:hypothetical protein